MEDRRTPATMLTTQGEFVNFLPDGEHVFLLSPSELSSGAGYEGGTPSTYSFAGIDDVALGSTELSLGNFSTHNGETEIGTNADSTDLIVQLTLRDGGRNVEASLTVPISFTVTTNEDGEPVASADSTQINSMATLDLTGPDGGQYTVEILGFRNWEGNGVVDFATDSDTLAVFETEGVSAELWARITVRAPLTATLKNYVLTVQGNDQDNDVAVQASGNKISVWARGGDGGNYQRVPIQSGRKQVPHVVVGQVKLIEMQLGDGNDQGANLTAKNARILGGPGVDVLLGGSAEDYLRGEDGFDTMDGGPGNDNLFGGDDGIQDELYGRAGMDVLFGGRDGDWLEGGSGADRFLMHEEHAGFEDSTADDAVIMFATGTDLWTQNQIETLDVGFALLVKRTNNTRLLQREDGGPMRFQKDYVIDGDPTTLGQNLIEDALDPDATTNTIQIAHSAFAERSLVVLTAIHELAHNWCWPRIDDLTAKWTSISWTGPIDSPDEPVAKPNAVFARHYGREDPGEDWATSWESYFMYRTIRDRTNVISIPVDFRDDGFRALPRSKQVFLDKFFDSMR